MKNGLLIILILSGSTLFCQNTTSSKIPHNKYPLAATINLSKIKNDWNPQLQALEMPAPGSNSYRRYLIDLKEQLYSNYQPTAAQYKIAEAGVVPAPLIIDGWEGNPMGNGVPNDNDMAISNNGKVVSVINSSIYMYDEDGTFLLSLSLDALADTLENVNGKFDPKVMYDPRADKFVLLFLAGFEPAETNIIIAFSKTNDPTGEWNLYSLPGNPKDNNRWTDFPMFALTEKELFLTINLIIPDEPWQTGFSETLIWQMTLDNGYAGVPLDALYRDNINFGGGPIRNLNPVKGGADTYGPDMYFLSDRNFAVENDTIFIVHVTGLLNDPGTSVEIDYSIADIKYHVPPSARQKTPHTFDTNDGRILGSFFEDGKIQFVSNTLNPATGFCGVYHGIISDLAGSKNIKAQIIGDDSLDIGYPNISYSGHWDGDDQSIIVFDHSSPEVFAGMSAVYFNYDAYSDLVNIKTGDSYVNIISGAYERWGDYTGSQRKYNEAGVVWVSGNFGKFIDGFPFTSRENATWIAKLKSTDEPAQNIVSIDRNTAANIYPNPMHSLFIMELDIPSSGSIQFRIYDMNGKLVKYLLNASAKKGKNTFSFSTEPLPSGNYIIEAQLNGQPFSTEKITKQ